MTAEIVEFPKKMGDVLIQLIEVANDLEAAEPQACIALQRDIIGTLLRENQKSARLVVGLSRALQQVKQTEGHEP